MLIACSLCDLKRRGLTCSHFSQRGSVKHQLGTVEAGLQKQALKGFKLYKTGLFCHHMLLIDLLCCGIYRELSNR